MKQYLTLKEVAEWLGVSDKTVSRLILSGKLLATKVGGVYRVRMLDLEDYLERQKVVPRQASELSDIPEHASMVDKTSGLLVQESVSCSRCQRIMKGPTSKAGECQESACGLPLCRICWSNEYDRRCRQHRLGFQEKLRIAQARLASGDIPVLVTAEDAKQKEYVFVQRFDQKIRETPYIISPLTGVKHPVSLWDSIRTETSDLSQQRLSSLRLLQPDLDSLILPQNTSLCYNWPPQNLKINRTGSRFTICLSVISDLTEMATNGFSASPVNRLTLLKFLEEKAAANKAVDSFLILGLASLTGWTKEARELIEGSPQNTSFSSLYVAPCLIDLRDNSIFFNPLDNRLKPFIPLYRSELNQETIYKIADWVRRQLSEGKISLSATETAEKLGVEVSLAKEAYLLLEEEGDFIIDMLPEFGLTISRKL